MTKITILTDIKDNFFLDFKNDLLKKIKKIEKKVTYIFDKTKIQKGDLLLCIGCRSILSQDDLKKNTYNVIVHPSKLPNNKGSAVISHLILRNKKYFYITFFEASSKIDSGDIYLQKFFKLNGTELCDEIRFKQAMLTIDMSIEIIKKIKKKSMIGYKQKKNNSKLLPKRTPKDSQIYINKTIRQQFNNLRAADNERYPSFFLYKGKKYIIKIYKSSV
jgi:methionyl-tRNA formyltransferase